MVAIMESDGDDKVILSDSSTGFGEVMMMMMMMMMMRIAVGRTLSSVTYNWWM